MLSCVNNLPFRPWLWRIHGLLLRVLILEEEGEGLVLAAAYEGRQQTFRQVLGRKESGDEGRENKEEVLFDLFTLLVDGIEIYGGIWPLLAFLCLNLSTSYIFSLPSDGSEGEEITQFEFITFCLKSQRNNAASWNTLYHPEPFELHI